MHKLVKMTEQELIRATLENLSEAQVFAFECESDKAKALGFMVDAALRYGEAISHDECPLRACCEFSEE